MLLGKLSITKLPCDDWYKFCDICEMDVSDMQYNGRSAKIVSIIPRIHVKIGLSIVKA